MPADSVAGPFAALANLVREGGPFVIAIYACGVALFTLSLERAWYFARVLPRESSDSVERWRARAERSSWKAQQIRRALLSRLRGAMTENLSLMRALVPLAPLLGLIGTVSGMLEVFDSMALRGSADARTLASGVSHAMICTLTGLAVSAVGLYPVFYFQGARAARASGSPSSSSSEVRRVRRGRAHHSPESHGIDLAPMLDFVLNLLLFFIITAVFVKELGLGVERAGAVASGAGESPGIAIRIGAAGDVELEGRAIDVRSVRANVERLAAVGEKPGVLIVAHPAARTSAVAAVVDQVRLGGVTNVRFASAAPAGGQ